MRTASPFAGIPARIPSAMLGRLQANGLPPGWPNRIPRGMLSSLISAQAQRTPAEFMAELTSNIEEFKDRHRGDVKAMQSAVDDIHGKLAAIGIMGGGGQPAAAEPEYTRPFAQWFRHGGDESELRQANAVGDRARIQAAMQSGDPSQGGYLAPVEWDRTIAKQLLTVSPMRRIANVISTTTGGFSTVWNAGGWGSGWVGETAERPQTSTPTLASVTYRAGELFAQPALTQVLLDDATFDIQGWLASELADTFARQEGIAFLAGDGTNKPRGLLQYQDPNTPVHPGGNLVVVPSGSASAITGDNLIDFALSLPSPYRTGARWLMSSLTVAIIRKLKDGQGNYLWNNDYQAGQPASLLGYPVEVDENMPSIAPGNTPIAFGDFKRGYTINDRFGTRILRDPYTVKGFMLFYSTRRVGGGVTDPNAIRLLKVAAS